MLGERGYNGRDDMSGIIFRSSEGDFSWLEQGA